MSQQPEHQQLPECPEAPNEPIGALLLKRLSEGQLSVRHLKAIATIGGRYTFFENFLLVQSLPAHTTNLQEIAESMAERITRAETAKNRGTTDNLDEKNLRAIRELLLIPPSDPSLRDINNQEEQRTTRERIRDATMQVFLKQAIASKMQTKQLIARHLVVICQILDRYDLAEYIKQGRKADTLSEKQAMSLTLRAIDENPNLVLTLQDILDVLETPSDSIILKTAVKKETPGATYSPFKRPGNETQKLQEFARRLEEMIAYVRKNLRSFETSLFCGDEHSRKREQEKQKAFSALSEILGRNKLLSMMPEHLKGDINDDEFLVPESHNRSSFYRIIQIYGFNLSAQHKTLLLLQHLHLLATKPLKTFLHRTEKFYMRDCYKTPESQGGEWYSRHYEETDYIKLLNQDDTLNLEEVDRYIKRVLFLYGETTLTLEQTLYLTSAIR